MALRISQFLHFQCSHRYRCLHQPVCAKKQVRQRAACVDARAFCQTTQAQTPTRIPLSTAVGNAFQNNLSLQGKQLSIERERLLTGSWFDLPKTAQLMEYKARDRHVQFEWALAPEPLLIRADAGQLEQVLINVVKNALEAIGRHGIISFSTVLHPPPACNRRQWQGLPARVGRTDFYAFFHQTRMEARASASPSPVRFWGRMGLGFCYGVRRMDGHGLRCDSGAAIAKIFFF